MGHWIEMRSCSRLAGLEQLVRLLPAEAHRVRADGSVEEVPLDALRLVTGCWSSPAKRSRPTASRSSRTSVNQAMLTASPSRWRRRERRSHRRRRHGEGAITIEVRRTGADTYLSQVIELCAKRRRHVPALRISQTARLWLTLIAIGGGTVTFVAWLGAGREFSFAARAHGDRHGDHLPATPSPRGAVVVRYPPRFRRETVC